MHVKCIELFVLHKAFHKVCIAKVFAVETNGFNFIASKINSGLLIVKHEFARLFAIGWVKQSYNITLAVVGPFKRVAHISVARWDQGERYKLCMFS